MPARKLAPFTTPVIVGACAGLTLAVKVILPTEKKDRAPKVVEKFVQSTPGHRPTNEGAAVTGPMLLVKLYPANSVLKISMRSGLLKCAKPTTLSLGQAK